MMKLSKVRHKLNGCGSDGDPVFDGAHEADVNHQLEESKP